MSTFTKEQLIEHLRSRIEHRKGLIASIHIDRGYRDYLKLELRSSEIALASLEAKPIGAFHIADQQVDGTSDYIKDGEWPIDDGVIEVYTAPPAPVSVPDTLADDIDSDDHPLLWSYNNGWNACRAAMLQGADGNSLDGWVACSERMPDNRGKSRELYVCWGTYFDGAEPDYIPALFFIHPTNGWCEWEPLEDDCDPKKVVITHWMPLPAAPQQEA